MVDCHVLAWEEGLPRQTHLRCVAALLSNRKSVAAFAVASTGSGTTHADPQHDETTAPELAARSRGLVGSAIRRGSASPAQRAAAPPDDVDRMWSRV